MGAADSEGAAVLLQFDAAGIAIDGTWAQHAALNQRRNARWKFNRPAFRLCDICSHRKERQIPMEMRIFGRSGMKISILGFGCGAVGGLMVRGAPADQERAIGRALDAGVNYSIPPCNTAMANRKRTSAVSSTRSSPRTVVVGTKVRLPTNTGRLPRPSQNRWRAACSGSAGAGRHPPFSQRHRFRRGREHI